VLLGQSFDDLGGSEYLKLITGKALGEPPRIDLGLEAAVQRCCLGAIRACLVRSAHDCSDGGLAVALAESCMAGGLGLECEAGALERLLQRDGCRVDAILFGESQSRIVLSLDESHLHALERLAGEAGVPLAVLGTVGGERFRLGGWIDMPVSEMRDAWSDALGRMLQGTV